MEAKLVGARLGAAGILVQLRGPVDDPYPIGDVTVLVEADGLELAHALLQPVDDLDAQWDDLPAPLDAGPKDRRRRRLVAVGGLVAVAGFAVARIAGAAL